MTPSTPLGGTNKAILFTIAILLSIILTISAQQHLKISLVQPHHNFLTRDQVNQVRIEVSDLSLNGIKFVAQAGASPKDNKLNSLFSSLSLPSSTSPSNDNTWIFDGAVGLDDVTQFNTIAFDNTVYCIDEATNTPWTYLTFDLDEAKTTGTSFSLYPVDKTRYEATFNKEKGFGKFTFLCPLRFVNDNIPSITNIHITAPLTDTTTFEVDADLVPKERKMYSPKLSFEKLQIVHDDDESTFSASTVTFDFRTNSTGLFTLLFENGPSFYPVSYTTGKAASFYCLVGGSVHSRAARIVYSTPRIVNVHLLEPTKSLISCVLTTRYEYNSIGDIHQEMIGTIVHHGIPSSLKLEQSARPASYRVDVKGLNETNISLSVVAISSSPYSSTPLNNSIVEYRFNNEFNITKLIIPAKINSNNNNNNNNFENNFALSDNFDISGPSNEFFPYDCYAPDKMVAFRGLLQIQKNSIFIHNTTRGESPNYTTSCIFDFPREGTFNVSDAKKGFPGGEIRVFVDKKPLSGHFAPEDEGEPFFFAPQYKLVLDIEYQTLNKSTVPNTQGLNDVKVDYIFSITNTTKAEFHAAPYNPHLLLSLNGPVPTNAEDYHLQIDSCYHASAVNTTWVSFESVKWNKKMFVWELDLSPLIKDKAIFDIKIKCSRNSSTLEPRYGLDLRPELTITGQVIDLIDKHRIVNKAINSPVKSKKESFVKTPTTKPTDASFLPQNASQQFCLDVSLELDSLEHFEQFFVEFKEAQKTKSSTKNERKKTNPLLQVAETLRNQFTTVLKQDFTIVPGYPMIALQYGDDSTSSFVDMKSGMDLFKFNTKRSDFTPFQTNSPQVLLTAGSEPSDPYQSLYGKMTAGMTLCLATNKPVDVGVESVWTTTTKAQLKLEIYKDAIKNGSLYAVIDIDTTFASFALPLIHDSYAGPEGVEKTVEMSVDCHENDNNTIKTTEPTPNRSLLPYIYSPVTECGWINGIKVDGQLNDAKDGFKAFEWELYKDTFNSKNTVLCPLDSVCTINADCSQSNGLTMCIKSVCTLAPLYKPTYIEYSDLASDYYKEFYFTEPPGFFIWLGIFGMLGVVLTSLILFALQRSPEEVDKLVAKMESEEHIQGPVVDEYREALIQ